MRLTTAFWAAMFAAIALTGLADQTEVSQTDLDGAGPKRADDALVVHEWGTFTSFSGSDGVQLSFRPLVEDDLPAFVLDRGEQWGTPNPLMKLSISARQRMETPVIYFYTQRERQVRVRVGFPQGLLTEFYPPVQSMKPAFEWYKPAATAESELDWGRIWLIPPERLVPSRLSPELAARIAPHVVHSLLPTSATKNHYEYARETDSALVYLEREPDKKHPLAPSGAFFEKFLFYRGVGNFKLPLELLSIGPKNLVLANNGHHPVRSLFLVTVEGEQICFSYYDHVDAGGKLTLAKSRQPASVEKLAEKMSQVLVAEGLYEKEARAMVKTWRDSWFGEEGTRLFYVMPRQVTDKLLPIEIDPKPDELVRVLVGRLEIMTSADELRITELVTRSAVERDAYTRLGHASRKGKSRPADLPAEILALGRFAEPALARVKAITRDDRVRHEAGLLLARVRMVHEARAKAAASPGGNERSSKGP